MLKLADLKHIAGLRTCMFKYHSWKCVEYIKVQGEAEYVLNKPEQHWVSEDLQGLKLLWQN